MLNESIHVASLPTRRQMLARSSTGFGTLALAGLLADPNYGAAHLLPAAAPKKTHHVAQAKHVIFCFMSGGVSHVDSTSPAASNRRSMGYTVPLGSPVCSMMSRPKTFPSAKAWRTQAAG